MAIRVKQQLDQIAWHGSPCEVDSVSD